jgi:hypothetical protein
MAWKNNLELRRKRHRIIDLAKLTFVQTTVTVTVGPADREPGRDGVDDPI